MRSGRMRKALRTRSRIVIAPTPSAFGGSGLEADDVLAGQPELGRVFDGHDALARRDQAASALSNVVLPLPVPPVTRMLRPGRDRLMQEISDIGRAEASSSRDASPEAADREARPVDRERRHHRVHS